jgi:hypothetical protein
MLDFPQMGPEMNSEKDVVSNGQEGTERDFDKYVPLSVRTARQMRKTIWPHLWMSFASIIILGIALAILSYRMGAQSCH